MSNSKARPVLLVGSVPLGSAGAVFEAVAASLEGLVKRIPDGEGGERTHWIMWQANVLKCAKGLEPGSSREIAPGYSMTLYKDSPRRQGRRCGIWPSGLCQCRTQLL